MKEIHNYAAETNSENFLMVKKSSRTFPGLFLNFSLFQDSFPGLFWFPRLSIQHFSGPMVTMVFPCVSYTRGSRALPQSFRKRSAVT